MKVSNNPSYFTASVVCHTIILLAFILGFDFSTSLPVFENSNKNDVINVVVLGDSPTSKILPHQIPAAIKQEEKDKQNTPKPLTKDVIALKVDQKKKLAEQKELEAKKQREMFAKDLLADIKSQKNKQKIKHKKLKSQFEKTLREQAEQSLRQQLLDEEIHLKGQQNRQAQGQINKYKALILQAISEHWIVPTQANKSLYCELMIQLAPNGTVLDVQITKSSGDPSLDRSARAAVLKASPLPVPKDAHAFAAFKQFILKVKPENILANKAVVKDVG